MKILKIILTVSLALFVSVQATAVNKKVKGNGNIISGNKTTAQYDKISVGGSFEVILVSGKEGEITYSVESNLEEYLVIEVKKGELKITWEKGVNVRTTKGVKVTVPFKDIEEVSLAGSGEITTKNVISADDLELNVAGSGKMNVDIDANNVESNIAGSGSMTVNGSAKNLESNVAGSGDFEGYGLVIVNDVDVSIAGSGSVEITVNGNLKSSISGSGDVRYKGNPKTNSSISGSGSVSKR
ncbi:MAG: head GIN domain-containing protein [Flavobacteriaceae bacterium]